MTINIEIVPSNNKNKKYDAVIHKPDGKTKTVSFGAKGYSDFTIHKDEQRKQRYLDRHRKNENWDDYTKPSFYATRILWNKSTLRDSIKDVNNKFKNLNVKMKYKKKTYFFIVSCNSLFVSNIPKPAECKNSNL